MKMYVRGVEFCHRGLSTGSCIFFDGIGKTQWVLLGISNTYTHRKTSDLGQWCVRV
jgi:hypothetical protein